MDVVVFFTYGISFLDWEKSGLLDREIKIYKELSEKFNYKFTFITYGQGEDLKYKNLILNSNIIPLYKYFKKPNNKFSQIFQSLIIPFKLKKLINSENYIIKTNQLYGSWTAIVHKLISKNPLIIRTGYDLLTFTIKQKKGFLKIFFYYLLTFLALNICNLYVSTSKADISFLQKNFLFKKNKISYIPNWVNVYPIVPILERDLKGIAVGRLEKQKDFSYLINYWKKLDIKLDIFGEGSEKKEIEKLIADTNNIELKGTLKNDRLIQKYSEYQIYVSTSEFEGNSKTLLEAMGAGCVAVVPNIKNNLEIINDYKNGILFSKKENNLLSILENLVQDSSLMANISNNAIKSINKSNSLESVIKLEDEDYKKLINNF